MNQDTNRLYFKQLLSGRDFGNTDNLAKQMVNFVYLIGDKQTGEALIVDPAYDVTALLDILEEDDMQCKGVLATHYHPDHVGGSMMGYNIVGVKELLERVSVPIHAQKEEAEFITKVTGLESKDVMEHSSGDIVKVGEIEIELIHTPVHTPGSQCFLVENRLVAGDTLFLEGCGRTDLPGGDFKKLKSSIQNKIYTLDESTTVITGHGPETSIKKEMTNNMVIRYNS